MQAQFLRANPGPDISVVVENAYSEFVTEKFQAWLATSPYDRLRTSYILHSVPQDKIAEVTRAMLKKAKYLFVTSATANFYEKFDPSWELFVKTMGDVGKASMTS